MSICTVEIDVAADPQRTFAFLADASNQPAWRHDVETCSLTEGTPGAAGAVYRQTNRGQEVEFRITEVDDDSSISWVCAEETSWPVRGTYRLSDLDGGGTRITMDLEMKPSGPFLLLRPLVPLMVKAQRKKYEAGLQGALG
ncbi:MAG: SRPBCC family protein [bacterium]|nr:SRPBCC family protein [bacterium]